MAPHTRPPAASLALTGLSRMRATAFDETWEGHPATRSHDAGVAPAACKGGLYPA
jgi:hypothetical protein